MPQHSFVTFRLAASLVYLCSVAPAAFAQESGEVPAPHPASHLHQLGKSQPEPGQPGPGQPRAIQPERFRPVPGVREFSGVLCARPVQTLTELRGATTAPLREIALRRLSAFEWKRYEPATDEYLIHVPADSSEEKVAAELLATGAFEFVEPDWLVYPVQAEVTGSSDPLTPFQWHHDPSRIDSDGAWAVETGRSSVVVAICDSGLRIGHEDFRALRREGFHVPSRTWQLDGGPVDDINGHGTWCTGVAVADGANGVGTAGVGWGLGYRPVRVTDRLDGSAFISDLTLGARAAAEAGDRIASVSYTGVTTFTVPLTAQYLQDQGSLLVWAAGNSAFEFPLDRNDGLLVVGATSPSDQLTEFSNRGSIIDLVAPGTGILTPGRAADDAYDYVAGTSFSCPMVAGVCGLVWSRNPNLTPDEVQTIVLSACDDLGEPGVDDLYGFGRLNAGRALERTPSHLLRFVYVDGRAREVDPAGGTTLNVVALPGDQQIPDVAAARFWVDSGAGFVATPAEYLGVNTFRGTFPPVPCGSIVRYYFEFPLESPSQGAGPADAGVLRSPARGSEAPFEAVAAALTPLTPLDTLDSPGGWIAGVPGDTATTGAWQWGRPVGSSAAPTGDHSELGNTCFVTGLNRPGASLGNNDIDGGQTTLTSRSIDVTYAPDPGLAYWRWYSNADNSVPDDRFIVDISADDGQTWVRVEELGPGPVLGGWERHAFLVHDYVPGATSVRLRFVAEDQGDPSIVEAAIDDIEAVTVCSGSGQ